MLESLRARVSSRQPYIASTGPGRWVIRHWDPIGRRWTDSGQTFFNKRDAKVRLKEARESFKKRGC